MPYYLINKHPVFLSWARHKKITEEALKSKDSDYKISSVIAGRKETKEAEKIIYQTLKSKCDKDPLRFYSDWVKFDLIGGEACQNVWDLLYDYCSYYGYAYLSDLRDFSKKLIDDYMGDSYTYPMGQVFAFNHYVKPARWWWRYTHRMNGRTLTVIIVSKNVTRLVGDLRNFKIYMDNLEIICGHNLEIHTSQSEKL